MHLCPGRAYRVHHWSVARCAPGLETVDIFLRSLDCVQIHGPRLTGQRRVDQWHRGAGRVVARVAEALGETDLIRVCARAARRAGVADNVSCALVAADAAALGPPQTGPVVAKRAEQALGLEIALEVRNSLPGRIDSLAAAVHSETLVALTTSCASAVWRGRRWKRRLGPAATGDCACEVGASSRRVLEVACLSEVSPELAARGLCAERAAGAGRGTRLVNDVVRVAVVVHPRVAPACAGVDLSNWLLRWADCRQPVGAPVHQVAAAAV